jgi:hypothetical protein
MPDDHHALMPRRNPEDIDHGAIKADLEFLIEWTERSRKEQALNSSIFFFQRLSTSRPEEFPGKSKLITLTGETGGN